MRLWLPFCAALFSLPSMVLAGSPSNYNLDHEHVPGQLLVRFEGEIPDEIKDNIEKILRNPSSEKFGIQSDKPKAKTALVGYFGIASEGDELRKKAELISQIPGVLSVEANVIYKLHEEVNDPDFEKLYGLYNPLKPGKDISILDAWELTTGSRDIVVGVIDTGIDYNHPDLAENIWVNPGESGVDANGNDRATNGIDDDGNGYVDDVNGWDFFNDDNDPMDGNSHGTHCAGTIGAVGNNGIGVVGVNWEVSLAALKVFSDGGSTTTDALAEAIAYATAQGMDLTSNSWGGGAESEVLRQVISDADKADILFVAAAGNSSSDNDASPHYPSSYLFDNIIAVASTDDNDELSGFSSYGATSVDVAAPGSRIYSTTPGGRYDYKSGTSMATPHVAGLVALAKSVFRDSFASAIKERILSTSKPLDDLEGKVLHGRINAFDALEDDNKAPTTPIDLQIIGTDLSGITLQWESSGDDGDVGEAAYYEVSITGDVPSEANFSQELTWKVPSSGSDLVVAKLTELPFNLTGYAAVRAVDNVGNKSPISPSVAFSLPKPQTIAINSGSLIGFESITGDWAVEVSGDNRVIRDNKSGRYENGIDIALTTKSYAANTGLILSFVSRYEIESKYDYGYIEISADNGNWQEVASFSGKQEDFNRVNYRLDNFIEGAERFQLRFRLKTDSSVTKEGWFIDEFSLLSTANN